MSKAYAHIETKHVAHLTKGEIEIAPMIPVRETIKDVVRELATIAALTIFVIGFGILALAMTL